MRAGDTIVALSSGSVPSGVAVLRISGPETGRMVASLIGRLPAERRLVLSTIRSRDGTLLDEGLVAWFPAPRSFTGEDCAELHVHGSAAVVRALLRELSGWTGARLAEAGEFTRRAFENGKLDRLEVEGLADLLEAETESQRQLALARARGGLSDRVAGWRDRLLGLRAEIEARLDFSDESDVETALPAGFAAQVEALAEDIAAVLASGDSGEIIREGFRVALAGPPNAGKSSLLNALAHSDIAIVTDEAGTTRDVREVRVELDGRLVILVDMAGLRETASRAEAEGVRRAHQELGRADLVLWLVAPDVADPGIPPGIAAPVWTVRTKLDLGGAEAPGELAVSVRDGTGLPALVQRLSAAVDGMARGGESALVSRERDRVALGSAREAILETLTVLDRGEMAAESLRRAGAALERLTGRLDAEAVLDHLFARFCIGK